MNYTTPHIVYYLMIDKSLNLLNPYMRIDMEIVYELKLNDIDKEAQRATR